MGELRRGREVLENEMVVWSGDGDVEIAGYGCAVHPYGRSWAYYSR
jgi:hypothetical protein